VNAENKDAQRQVHEAIGGLLDDGEIAICWVLTIDVAGPNDTRYLAHRAGGGHDGNDNPMAWTAAGMLQASADMARDQMRRFTVETDDEDEDE
jgi:hypothetical protein